MTTVSTGGIAWNVCDQPGCIGVTAPPYDSCLAHLRSGQRARVLIGTTAGILADFRGVAFTAELFEELCGRTRFLQSARFDHAQFLGDVTFSGVPWPSAVGMVSASDIVFLGDASFRRAVFRGSADFGTARFRGRAAFDGARFEGEALFDEVSFGGHATFHRAVFEQYASFRGVRAEQGIAFHRARFAGELEGTLVSDGTVDLSGTSVAQALRLQVAATALDCTAATFNGPNTLQLRYAAVDLTDTDLHGQTSLNWHLGWFSEPDGSWLDDSFLPGSLRPRVVSLRGVDAAQLMLTDIGLEQCRFFGARNLDQIHMAGECTFQSPATRWTRIGPLPFRWSRRNAIADEHQWRRQGAYPRGLAWSGDDYDVPGVLVEPDHIGDLYRQLRKALEDRKYEPGAADFYYGEMEMRRRAQFRTTLAERWLLHAYWLLSGYGLRASRALGWLALTMMVSVLLLLGLGLPDSDPQQVATGTVPAAGRPLSLTIATQDPRLTLPADRRFTGPRADRALRIVLNSAVFRSGDADLTTWGTYTEMAGRFSEPVLLGLAALAVRGRIKRG